MQEIEIRKRLHSQIVFGVGAAGLIISFLINPGFVVRPVTTFVPVTLSLCAVWGALAYVASYNAIKLLSITYVALLTSGFRIQLNAMDELGPYWTAPVAVEIVLATAFIFNSRKEYLFGCLIVVTVVFVGQPDTYFASVSGYILFLSIASSVLVGCLLNHAVMTCIRELYATKERFRLLSSADPLTGLSNRRAFMDHLEDLLANPNKPSFCFAMIDIDDFKSINDRYGHEMGDRVLVAFARRASALFTAGAVGRLGGEEFAVLLKVDTDEEAMVLMVKLLDQVRQEHVGAVSFTFSAGLVPITIQDGATVILRQADAALYKAKRSGKARILWAQGATKNILEPARSRDNEDPHPMGDQAL